MISVDEAISIIEENVIDVGIESVSLEQAVGRILAENLYCDRDLPPYDRVTMDGIALNALQFDLGQRSFHIEDIAAAGTPVKTLKNAQNCIEVMTGGVTPLGTNAVVRYEDLEIKDNIATVNLDHIKPFQNIHHKGSDKKEGDLLIPKGSEIRPAEIGIGASIGKAIIKVRKTPNAMIISTGDELTPIDQSPLPHQIRRSNVYRIKAGLNKFGIKADTDHLIDNKEDIRSKLSLYLKSYNVIILSGGVSKGKFDFIPTILEELNVNKLFHRVSQRPGKPFWFGRTNDCTIFALPGNPISSFLCLQKYFTHWLTLSLIGKSLPPVYAELESDVYFKPDLTYFLEVKLTYSNTGKIMATPTKGNGSGDLANLTKADAFIELPKGKSVYLKGECYGLVFF